MTLLTLIISFSAASHEGHNKIPGNISAPHGGLIKGTAQLYLELVSDSSGFKVYATDHDLKPVSIKDIKLEASVKFPKQKKSEKLVITTSDNYWESKVDAKGSHRYTTELKVIYQGKTENVSFNVEPQE